MSTTKIQLAGCVILDDYGRILLIHRSAAARTQWELPGGKLEPDELPEDAAEREVAEELGVSIRLVKPLGYGAFEEGEKVFHYTWFQAAVTHGEPAIQESQSFDDLDYFELEDLPSLALSANMLVLFGQIVSGDVALQT